tara:strand:+ start:433 stop:675 length:243 start_codon:yes stop_codon:yes gene_type:complete
MKYVLFVKDNCPFCVKAIELLESKNLNYSVINFLPDQHGVLSEIKHAFNWQTVPMIILKDGKQTKFIGGYTDLAEELENE